MTKKEVLIEAIKGMTGEFIYILQKIESDKNCSGMFFSAEDKEDRINYFNECFDDELQHLQCENLIVVGFYDEEMKSWVIINKEDEIDGE